MDEEIIVVQGQEENYDEVVVEDLISDVEKVTVVENIDVSEQEDIVIKINETIGSPSAGNGDYAASTHTHKIGQVEQLSEVLHDLASPQDSYFSTSTGFAEFRPWDHQGKYWNSDLFKTGGVGYFVSLVRGSGNIDGNNMYIDVCQKDTDVYGVTVASSGFLSNQNESYDPLISSTLNNRMGDGNFAKVCLFGCVKVRIADLNTVKVGEYVLPTKDGYAEKSENSVGFKVTSKGQIEKGWNYVEIALVPQNDNVARELNKANVNINNVTLQLGNVQSAVDKMDGITVEVSQKVDSISKEVATELGNMKVAYTPVAEALAEAKEIATQAETRINAVAANYTTAVSRVTIAEANIQKNLENITALQNDMDVIAKWEGEDGESTVAGFVQQVKENNATLGSLTQAFGPTGSELAAIIQKIDANGAAIQHLVTHVDKYILGKQSPANDLTPEQTGFIQPGTIYVPTEDSKDTYQIEGTEIVRTEFKYGKSYIWATDDYGIYTWKEYGDVLDSEVKEEGALWYCWEGVYNDTHTILLYDPGTLYCWTKTGDKVLVDGKFTDKYMWVPVASADDKNVTSIGSVNQTAKNLQINYSNLKGEMASLEVKVDGISSTVSNEVEKKITSINQTAEDIMMGVYGQNGTSSLGLLLKGMMSTSTNATVTEIKTVKGTPPVGTSLYKFPPTWDGQKFLPVGGSDTNGTYFFENDPATYYCEIVPNTGTYKVWGVNNLAMTNLGTRVSDTESAIESWSKFEKGQSETVASIKQETDVDSGSISSVVFGDYRECVEIKTELTEEEKERFKGENKYEERPSWNSEEGRFEFAEGAVKGKTYCILGAESKYYYKLLYDNTDNLTSYEKYGMQSSPYSMIVQKVDDNGNAYIGLVAGNDEDEGKMVVNTINGHTEALISADKISINGTTTFSSILNPGETTTISGNYIRSGVIESNNYKDKQYGTKFDLTNGTISSKNFNVDSNGNVIITGSLMNNQSSLIGNNSIGTPGVYVGTNGIGFGNGNTWISQLGEINITSSAYLQFSDTSTSSPTLFMNDKGITFYKDDLISGYIGLNYWQSNPEVQGFTFGMRAIDYISWSVWDDTYTENDVNGIYRTVLAYHANDHEDTTQDDTSVYYKGLHVEDNLFLHNYQLVLSDKTGITGSYFKDGHYYKTGTTLYLGSGSYFDIAWASIANGKVTAIGQNLMRIGTTGSDYGNVVFNSSVYVAGTMRADEVYKYSNGWKTWSTSDYRLKTNIVDMMNNALDVINNIDIKSYRWIKSGEFISAGIIAQQLEEVIPELVCTDNVTSVKMISYEGLIPYLIKAVQELSEKITLYTGTSVLANKITTWVDDMAEDEKRAFVEKVDLLLKT